MTRTEICGLLLCAMWILPLAWSMVYATEPNALPIQSASQWPALLLELGNPASAKPAGNGVLVSVGEVVNRNDASTIQIDNDAINSLHPGFGQWRTDFRFQLPPGLAANSFQFWARWKQGGDPSVCVQTFEIWAGPDAARLEPRATLTLKPGGWEYAWVSGPTPVQLKANDRIVEVRNAGAGHDAKVFDAFLLASPWSALPATGSKERPLTLLELGNSPALAGMESAPAIRVVTGTATPGPNAASLLTAADEVQVFHPGFDAWGAQFRFELEPPLPAGQYRIFARYKSGGEVSQVEQRFSVNAGAAPDQLATRGSFALTNTTPWEYQWLQAPNTITILPGDRWLELDNDGKADGAKVFDAFLLQLETPLANAISEFQAELRNRFLAMTKTDLTAPRRLYLLDGPGEQGDSLLRGLASAGARTRYANLPVTYLVGAKADAMARELALQTLPAAVIADDHYSVLGNMSAPTNEVQVLAFLDHPEQFSATTTPPPATVEPAQPLHGGVPAAWLVGGVQDGRAGMALFGLDAETVLRPNPDQTYPSLEMAGGRMRSWQAAPTRPDGSTDIIAGTQHAYGWSRGSGYAALYLHVDQAEQALLHLHHSGIHATGWLDGKPLSFGDDPRPPAGRPSIGENIKTLLNGLTTEGLAVTAQAEQIQPPQVAKLDLSPGWHSLFLKLTMQHNAGERFHFSAYFSANAGQPLTGIQSQLHDPAADLGLNRIAAKLRPLLFTDAPANLPHPGERVKLALDLRWHPLLEEPTLEQLLPRFAAKLRLRVVDYQGKLIAERELDSSFPGSAEADLGVMAEPGYYAVYPSLYTTTGRLIMHYPPGGFAVVAGSAAQKQRLAGKKLWNNDYYALADGDKSFRQPGDYFAWLERMGIYQSLGSYPGFDDQYRRLWDQAGQRGIHLFADSAGDSHWLNDNPDADKRFIAEAARYTPFFKASNEIDIRHEPDWQRLREPAHWVERMQREYQEAHRQRPDAHFIGGSLVRPGEGDWFKQVLQLGLDRYQDAWDVHAYPQQPPRFGGPIGNGDNEDERGVLATYASLGKKNTRPFWLGETGAKAMHGASGWRWQAEQVAKMLAWANSRNDYLGIAFCIAHEYDLAYGRLWDYSLGHKPGEAALYTASALIDGLPYRPVDTHDPNVQAGYFGETLMLWRSDGESSVWLLNLDPKQPWRQVDVVGHSQKLALDSNGKTAITLNASPVYVLPEAEYTRLTAD